MPHFLTNQKFDLLSYIYIINFLNLPVHALIHDLQKKTYGHQLGPMTHFLTTSKFDLLLYIGEKMWKKTLFLSLFLEKEVKLGKNQKKAGAGINCGPWPIFPNITHLTHFYIWGVKCSGHIFFFTFSGKNRSNNKIFVKKTYRHQLQPMTHFLTNQKFDLLSYIYIINLLNLPVRALIHDLQKKTYGHQLGPMTHFWQPRNLTYFDI